MTRSASARPLLDPESTRLLNPAAAPLLDADARAGAPRAIAPPAAARAVLALLGRMRHGRIALTTPDGRTQVLGAGEPQATLRVADWRVFGAALSRGDIGFAEGWIDGAWTTDHLPTLLRVLAMNRATLERAIHGSAWGRAAYRLRHLLNRNSRAGARRNVHAHYDLGNRFYEAWLDPSMTYSSALFGGDPSRTLADAQRAKYRRILDALALPAGSRVLEIGCGWGGFAELAARDGLDVTGLTLSTEQRAYATRRLADAGLDARARVRLQDYRDERGRYDAIVSIEMFEAVGEAYWPAWFGTLARCLAPGGRALVQTITIRDALFDDYRRSTDFIQQYVFPGGMLPSRPAFERGAHAAGLAVDDAFAFGADYARTLALWRDAFLAAWPRIAAQGFDARFARTWEFYLAYCEAGFAQGDVDVVQYALRAPR